MPDKLGLSFDPKERTTVAAVAPGSPADKAGFKAGDVVRKMEGQPLISIADVQWVLHLAKEPGSVKAEVDRGGQKQELTLAIAAGWRHADDFTWRLISWSMRHKLLGTEPLEVVPLGERKTLGIPDSGMAIRVQRFPPDWVKEKNPQGAQKLKQGDVIVDVDGNKKLTTEAELLAYLFQKKPPGQAATLTVMRGGKPQQVQLTVP
jgi:S1-C subfamily serine protease